MTVVEQSVLRRVAYLGAALLIVVLLLVAVVSLAPTQHDRFTRSAAAMEALARTLTEGGELPARSLGGLPFERIFRKHNQVYFQQGRNAFTDDTYGYLWSPHAQPPNTDHLTGPWYAYPQR
ncbi:hypothetical protein [Nonomuraea sediminis]|uniref:hypothetical protein n=1 Tax=Nonomuraea sediminis TaxID=2835864 RepID=UPI001BDCC9C1|nr:hypothetical protein [Nonomuraea sediminis]